MSDAKHPGDDDLFSTLFKPSAEVQEYIAKKERECVPPEMAEHFTALNLSAGLFGGAQLMAGCNRCGALVYPTALDRHMKFHEACGEVLNAAS